MQATLKRLEALGYTHIIKGSYGVCAYIRRPKGIIYREVIKLDTDEFEEVEQGVYEIEELITPKDGAE